MPTETLEPITPPTLTVLIQGLVVINRTKTGFWEAAMLEGIKDHPSSLSVTVTKSGSHTTDKIDISKAKTVELKMSDDNDVDTELFEPTKPDNTPDMENDRHVAHMGNFASPELHNGKVNLQRPISPLSLRKFRVKGGMGYAGEFASGDDRIPDIYLFAKERNVARRIPYQFVIERKTSRDATLDIHVDGTSTRKFDLIDVEGIVVTFDNMCHNDLCSGPQPPFTDFRYYYDVEMNGSTVDSVINEDAIDLLVVQQKRVVTGKIACNAMLLSTEIYDAGLWGL